MKTLSCLLMLCSSPAEARHHHHHHVSVIVRNHYIYEPDRTIKPWGYGDPVPYADYDVHNFLYQLEETHDLSRSLLLRRTPEALGIVRLP